jgi:hypothetical protein
MILDGFDVFKTQSGRHTMNLARCQSIATPQGPATYQPWQLQFRDGSLSQKHLNQREPSLTR